MYNIDFIYWNSFGFDQSPDKVTNILDWNYSESHEGSNVNWKAICNLSSFGSLYILLL